MGRDTKCRYCQQELIYPSGPNVYEYALIGEFPGKTEVEIGKPFVGVAGNILRRELARMGIDIDDLLLANLWPHPKTENEHCLDVGMKLVLSALKPAKYVLLMGSECSQAFLQENVTSISSLWVNSNLLPNKKVMCTVNPANLLHGNVGEFRLSLELFFGKIKRENIRWDGNRLKALAKN